MHHPRTGQQVCCKGPFRPKTQRAYVNNAGRLLEYLAKGRRAFCLETGKTLKTDCRLFSIAENGLAVVIDTQLQMMIFEKSSEMGLIPWARGCVILQRNARLGNSLIDCLLECEGGRVYLEVKSAVLRKGNYAMYPDCPSPRGRKHIKELAGHVKDGGRATILFIVLLSGIEAFKPNESADPELCSLLSDAYNVGVEVRSIGLYYRPKDSFVYLSNADLEVNLFGDFEKVSYGESDLRQILEDMIKEYNRYRSPEATARLVSVGNRMFRVEFKGPFCFGCGFYDYFDDYRILLEETGLKTKITEIKEIEEGAIVKFEMAE